VTSFTITYPSSSLYPTYTYPTPGSSRSTYPYPSDTTVPWWLGKK